VIPPEERASHLARPVEVSEQMEPECCSFSPQIPGVVDGVSKLFQAVQFPDLVTIDVSQDRAIETARQLIRRGFPVGPSSGLNDAAAVMAARRMEGNSRIVTVFPDRMERYFTTRLFNSYRQKRTFARFRHWFAPAWPVAARGCVVRSGRPLVLAILET